MKKLQITIDRVNETVTTFGMIHSMKGNVDGTINFEEAGINNEMSDDEIEEYFIEKHEDYEVTVIIEKYFVVRQTGMASPSDRTEYFGRFSNEHDANIWIDNAIDTCLSNESFEENEKTEFGVSKNEMDSKFRKCYEIFEKGDSEIENEKIQN